MSISKEKKVILQAARHACKILLKYYGKNQRAKEKSNKSLVSKADIEANRVIIKIIKKNFPEHSILSEESGFEDNKSDYKWVIDPLDGTHNFLHEIPIFGTSIALEYKDEIVLGVLNFPLLRQTAFAEKGKGAFLNGKRIKVSDKKNIKHSFIAIEFTYIGRKEKIDFLEGLVHEPHDARAFGSAIYSLLLVACGKSDAYIIFSTNEWDIAAGFLIVDESGGKITDLKGRKYNLHQDKFIISNGKLHNEILKFAK